jgi:hypothetical protein
LVICPIVGLKFSLFIRRGWAAQNQDFEHRAHVIRFPSKRRNAEFLIKHRHQLRRAKISRTLCALRPRQLGQLTVVYRQAISFIEEIRLVNTMPLFR